MPYIYIADRSNNRIVKRSSVDLSYVSKIGIIGVGNDNFSYPMGICTDGMFVYVADTSNNRIVKRLCTDLSYVAKIGSTGSGNDQFNNPTSICTDGTYLYLIDQNNYRIVKRLCSDLSYVSQFGAGHSVANPMTGLLAADSISTDGTYLYVSDRGGEWFSKYRTSDLSCVTYIFRYDYVDESHGSVTDGTYVWVLVSGSSANTAPQNLVKRSCSTLASVWAVGTPGTGATQFGLLRGNPSYDGTYIYIADVTNNRILKYLASDGSYVAGIGSTGSGNDQFNEAWAVACSPITPPVISGDAGPGPKQITITWPDVPNAVSYNLYFSLSPGVTKGVATEIVGVTSPYLHLGLEENTRYYYAATALTAIDETELSGEIAVTTFGSTDSTKVELFGQARLSIYLQTEIDAFDVFSQINAAVGSYLFNDHLGKYRYVVYLPPVGASVLQFTEADIFSFEEDVDATAIISLAKAKFAHRVLQDYWQVQFADRPEAQYLQGAASPILKEIEFPFVQASDGLKGAQRTVLHEGIPQRTYKVKVSSKGWTLLPSDFIQITYSRHGVNGVFEVIETKRDLVTGLVELVVGGLRGLVSGGTSGGFGYTGHWTPWDGAVMTDSDGAYTDSDSDGAVTDTEADGGESEPFLTTEYPIFPGSLGGGHASPWDRTWSTDQKAYAKQNFGYWCDESGFADPLDPESFLPSTWI